MVKFNKFNVSGSGRKAKVWYSLDNRANTPCVTIYAKDYGPQLRPFFPDKVVNETRIEVDYFDKDKVTFYPGELHYEAARARAEANVKQWAEKVGKR